MMNTHLPYSLIGKQLDKANPKFGDYFTYYAEWWELRKRANIFFITYEELKKDTAAGIRRLAKYLETELTDEQVHAIVEATSMSNMKKTSCKAGPQMADAFFRKGAIGDWKNYLTDEQCTLLDEQSSRILEPIGL